MSSAAAKAAIEAWLTAHWTTLPLVQDSNVNPASRPAGFVTVDYLPGRETPISLGRPGANRYREDGQAQISVLVQVGVNGDTDAETYANQIRAIYRGKHFSGVRVHGVPAATNRSDGRYYIAAFVVPYTFDNAG